MHTAIYCRVSTEEQASDGFSIKAQKDKLTKYADANDYLIVDYYVDDGISGKNLKDRPEVTRLINDVKSGKVNNVLVYKLDRLTRSVKDLIYLIDLFSKYDCSFNSQTEKLDTSNAVGRMFVKIVGIFAEFERENLAERVALGYEQKTKEGNYTNCNGVFGYDYVIGGILNVNDYEKGYVNKIYNSYLEGNSMLKIAKMLRDEGVTTKRGGNWNQSTIYSILTNPLYIGNVRYGVHKTNNFEVNGKNITPIIDENLFNNVQSLIKKRKKFRTKKYSSDDTYYFKVLKCSVCGGNYHARGQIQSGKKYITYACNGHYNGTCEAKGFSHFKLEKAFLDYLDKISDFEYDEKVLDIPALDNQKEIDQIKSEINKLNIKRKDTINLFAEDKIEIDTLKEIQNTIDNKITLLNDKLNNLNINTPVEEINYEEIKLIITNLKNNFLHLNNHERKLFLERFVSEIKVRKDGENVVIDKIVF